MYRIIRQQDDMRASSHQRTAVEAWRIDEEPPMETRTSAAHAKQPPWAVPAESGADYPERPPWATRTRIARPSAQRQGYSPSPEVAAPPDWQLWRGNHPQGEARVGDPPPLRHSGHADKRVFGPGHPATRMPEATTQARVSGPQPLHLSGHAKERFFGPGQGASRMPETTPSQPEAVGWNDNPFSRDGKLPQPPALTDEDLTAFTSAIGSAAQEPRKHPLWRGDKRSPNGGRSEDGPAKAAKRCKPAGVDELVRKLSAAQGDGGDPPPRNRWRPKRKVSGKARKRTEDALHFVYCPWPWHEARDRKKTPKLSNDLLRKLM